MNEPPQQPAEHDPLAALRQWPFILYSLNRVGATIGQAMFQTVLMWQVYDITGSAFSLGLLGLVRFFPSLATSLIGGAVADAYDRRVVMIVAKIIPFSCGVILAVATLGDWVSLGLILGLSVFMGIAMAFEGPARIALLPAIVRAETFENAVTVSNTMQKLAMVVGPTIAGLVIAVAGAGAGYMVFCASVVIALVPLLLLRYAPSSGPRQRVSVAAIKEGVAFVMKRQVLLGAMALDMFAVIFGGAQALLPVYAADVLHVGPTGFGVLSSSMQIGAFSMAAIMVMRQPVVSTGRVLIYSVVVYGLLTVAFGASTFYVLSILLYGLIGAADQVSVVMRQTTIQMATPDELRGRVSSVNQVFVGASGQIGGMRAGFVAAVAGPVFAVVSGGIGAVLVAALIAWKMPQLFNYEIKRGGVVIPNPEADIDQTALLMPQPDGQEPASKEREAAEAVTAQRS
ncbi:MAG: MFS transporter [Dehalococcoidia bacterium]|nr:MFS transporter [Dehalococcoidia bacterium]